MGDEKQWEEQLARQFAKNLTRIMDKKGVTVTELARRSGVGQTNISDYRKPPAGRKVPALPNALRLWLLCRALNVSADELLFKPGERKGSTPTVETAYVSGGADAIAEIERKLEELKGAWVATAGAKPHLGAVARKMQSKPADGRRGKPRRRGHG